MFTGIVQAACPVVVVERRPDLRRIVVAMPKPLCKDLAIGASVAVNGVCLTVTHWDDRGVYFDLMADTLSLTTLADLADADRVNVERSMRQGAEIGGHLVSGHIDGRAEIVGVEQQPDLRRVRYRPPAHLLKYLLTKGFVALNGCSLTLAAVDAGEGWFEVGYIPETLRTTTHATLGLGDSVNLEVDRQTQAIVATVERIMAEQLRRP